MTPIKKHVSLKAMAEDKEFAGVGKVTTFAVDPRIMRKPKPGSNRPIDPEHVRTLADAYHRGAVFPPLEVVVDEGGVEPVDGQHRLEAALLAISEGAAIHALECRQFRGSDADKVLLQLSSQSGLKMTPLVMADRYNKLVGWGWTPAEIAEHAGKSTQHVRDILALLDADPKTKKMLEKGQVSADVVRTAMRQHGADAGAVLEQDLKVAKAEGKDKVTPKTASTKPASRLQTALDLLDALRNVVEAMDGTGKENEKIVDAYWAFMGKK